VFASASVRRASHTPRDAAINDGVDSPRRLCGARLLGVSDARGDHGGFLLLIGLLFIVAFCDRALFRSSRPLFDTNYWGYYMSARARRWWRGPAFARGRTHASIRAASALRPLPG
jgi:hypothetical protein